MDLCASTCYRADMEDFRALLKERLRERGALARLAEASGIKSPVIGRWAAGETQPSPANLERLAPVIGVPFEDLMKMVGYLPGDPSPNVNPRLSAFLAAVEAGWLAMDDARRDLAERGARALFSVQPAQSTTNRRRDDTAKRLDERRRNLGRRTSDHGDNNSDDPLTNRSHGAGALVSRHIPAIAAA